MVAYAYVMQTNSGRGQIFAAGEPGTRLPDPIREFVNTTTQVGHHGEMELVVDNVTHFSQSMEDGWVRPDRYADFAMGTNHMRKNKPDGGNIGFLDGHAT